LHHNHVDRVGPDVDGSYAHGELSVPSHQRSTRGLIGPAGSAADT
jgi:hypothetical protein